jgi:hypothetical protein
LKSPVGVELVEGLLQPGVGLLPEGHDILDSADRLVQVGVELLHGVQLFGSGQRPAVEVLHDDGESLGGQVGLPQGDKDRPHPLGLLTLMREFPVGVLEKAQQAGHQQKDRGRSKQDLMFECQTHLLKISQGRGQVTVLMHI